MIEPVTDEEARRWGELEQAATPGPWMPDPWCALRDSDGHLVEISTTPQNGWNDARFISIAREAMPRLLADRERLKAMVDDANAFAREREMDTGQASRAAEDMYNAAAAGGDEGNTYFH